MKADSNIIFMGTAAFAVPSLRILVSEGYSVVAVVTAPDKPAGRGKKIKTSPVKEYAIEQGIKVLQPTNLKDPDFVDELKFLNPDIQVVVAFRMLPRAVWAIPRLGTLNLHASLLPHYRGAAPINHAIFNGESESGVTTFMIDEKIDTGSILYQRKTKIGDSETAGELHDRLMILGADLVKDTVKALLAGEVKPIPQEKLSSREQPFRLAPKIFKEHCRISWNNDVDAIYNLIRGLSPVPGAYTSIRMNDGSSKNLKIFRAEKVDGLTNQEPGSLRLDQSQLFVACKNGNIRLTEVQVEGKRKMDTESFLRGFPANNMSRLV